MPSGGFSFGILERSVWVLVVLGSMFYVSDSNRNSNYLTVFMQEINYETFYRFASCFVYFRDCLC